jgi:hypothetical protein
MTGLAGEGRKAGRRRTQSVGITLLAVFTTGADKKSRFFVANWADKYTNYGS